MAKLYHEDGGWAVPGTQSRRALRVDVPNAPFDLAVWLNARHVPPEPCNTAQLADELLRPGTMIPDAIDEQGQIRPEIEKLLPKVPGHCNACGRSVAGTLKLAAGNDVDALEAWAETIQGDNLWALGRAADIIRDRARELGANIEGSNIQ